MKSRRCETHVILSLNRSTADAGPRFPVPDRAVIAARHENHAEGIGSRGSLTLRSGVSCLRGKMSCRRQGRAGRHS